MKSLPGLALQVGTTVKLLANKTAMLYSPQASIFCFQVKGSGTQNDGVLTVRRAASTDLITKAKSIDNCPHILQSIFKSVNL